MDANEQLAQLDQHFVDIYEAARTKVVERQKHEASGGNSIAVVS